MTLKVRLRSDERLALNGAVIRNLSPRSVEIEILNEVTLLHERDIMLPEEADTPLKTLYLLLQTMHLDSSEAVRRKPEVIKLASAIFSSAFTSGDTQTCALINSLMVEVGTESWLAALRYIQKSAGRPGDLRAVAAANDISCI